MSYKDNLKKILKTIKLQVENQQLARDYFNSLFDDLTSQEDKLSILSFNRYMKLPFVISKKIFLLFDSKKEKYLTKKSFSNGMMNLYFPVSGDNRIKFIFSLYLSYCFLTTSIRLKAIILLINYKR